MNKILKLALAPIRKNKGQTVSLLVFSLITAMFLNIGLMLYFGISGFYDERAEANHSAHFSGIYFSGCDSIEQGQKFMEKDPRVAETEKVSAVGGYGEYSINEANISTFILLTRYEEKQKIDAPSFVGEHLPLTGNRIYIPYNTLLNGGLNIGDSLNITFSGVEFIFTIAGTTEEITFGSAIGTNLRFYISDEKFNEVNELLPDNGITLLSVRLNNAEDIIQFKTDYDKEVSADGLFYNTMIYNDAKQPRIMVPTIIAIVITAFAIILLTVSLLVIRFRIINGIEEGMTNIGVQKAMGFKNIQIIAANVTQYGLVALAGGILGVITAGAVTPVITKIFEPLIALVWNPGFDINIIALSILFVLLSVTLITLITSRKIKRLHPLTALRGGTTTHSFKKNAFPLDKSYGSLTFLLALKQIIQNKKQTVTVGIIIAAITMTAVVGISLKYSMNDGRDTFIRTMFDETAATDVAFILKNGDDGDAFREKITEYPEIRKVLAYEAAGISLLINEVNITTYVTEDCSLLESQMLVTGYYPKHNNEIVLGNLVLEATGKKVGDTVKIRIEDKEYDYIITGIVQSMNSNGFFGLITAEGARVVEPDFMFTNFLVYMNEGSDIKAITESIQTVSGDIFKSLINLDDQIGVTMDSMGAMFAAVSYGIIAVTVFIVILTLYLVIKTTILRRKRELGIQKAIGFTTLQLMNQIALNMTPVIILGVLAGTVAGYFGFNPLFAALTRGAGIAKSDLPAPLDQIIVVCIALVILAYVVAMMIAWRIRKISAYSLVSE